MKPVLRSKRPGKFDGEKTERDGVKDPEKRLSGNFLVIDPLGITLVEMGDESRFDVARFLEQLLHGFVGAVRGTKKFASRAGSFHGPDQRQSHPLAAHFRVDHDEIDEMMAVKILGPNEESRGDPSHEGDEGPFFPEGGFQKLAAVPLGGGGLIDLHQGL